LKILLPTLIVFFQHNVVKVSVHNRTLPILTDFSACTMMCTSLARISAPKSSQKIRNSIHCVLLFDSDGFCFPKFFRCLCKFVVVSFSHHEHRERCTLDNQVRSCRLSYPVVGPDTNQPNTLLMATGPPLPRIISTEIKSK
jgi:hypothetical protein